MKRIVIDFENPTVPPEVNFFGEDWKMKEIASVQRNLQRAYAKYKKEKIILSKVKEIGEQDE
jgi:hypothetical protein